MTIRKLYKYRTLNGDYGMTNAEDILLNDRMRWQSPADFNDPFDCVPEFDRKIDTATFRRWLSGAQAHVKGQISRNDRRSAITKKLKTKADMIASLEVSFAQALSQSSVTCFSLVENQPLMWAHYADAHTGIMFEFEQPGTDTAFHGLDVSYVDKRPLVDPTAFLAGDTEIKKAILTKSDDWNYEQEVRMVEYRRPPGPRCFKPSYLKSVTLGLKISDDHKQTIIDIVGRRRFAVPILQATLEPGTYKIQSRPVT